MNFYNIKNEYIEYLRSYDKRIALNKNETRPYVGVVFEISSIKFYVPFSSPKPKHLAMKNCDDFRKINFGKYGAINFNNMIPVPDDVLIPLHFASIKDNKYRILLQNQYEAIKSDWEEIVKTAHKLYNLLTKRQSDRTRNENRIAERCCDIVLLEKVYLNYK